MPESDIPGRAMRLCGEERRFRQCVAEGGNGGDLRLVLTRGVGAGGPCLGQQSEEVLRELLGLDQAAIAELRRNTVI